MVTIPMTNITIWVLSFLHFVALAQSFSLWPFPDKKFAKNALLNAGSLGLSSDERVVAFGDFNGDQLCVMASWTTSCRTDDSFMRLNVVQTLRRWVRTVELCRYIFGTMVSIHDHHDELRLISNLL